MIVVMGPESRTLVSGASATEALLTIIRRWEERVRVKESEVRRKMDWPSGTVQKEDAWPPWPAW